MRSELTLPSPRWSCPPDGRYSFSVQNGPTLLDTSVSASDSPILCLPAIIPDDLLALT